MGPPRLSGIEYSDLVSHLLAGLVDVCRSVGRRDVYDDVVHGDVGDVGDLVLKVVGVALVADVVGSDGDLEGVGSRTSMGQSTWR